MQVNVFEVVSYPCTDDIMEMLYATVHTKHKLSRFELCVERVKDNLEVLPWNLSILDLGILHARSVCMCFAVIFGRNRNKGNENACKIQWLWFKCQFDVSMYDMYWTFFLVTWIVCKMWLVRIAANSDNRSSKWPKYLLKGSKSL